MVGNAGTQEIRFYDWDGAYISTSGGQGKGPGEFTSLRWVQRLGNDSLAALNLSPPRVSILDSDGMFVRSVDLHTPDDGAFPYTVGLLADGSMLVSTNLASSDRESGVRRHEITALRYTADGYPADRIGSFPGTELFLKVLDGGKTRTMMPLWFGRNSYLHAGNSQIYVATNDSYEIKVFSREGHLKTIIRKSYTAVDVTQDDIQEMWRRVDDSKPSDAARRRFEKIVRDMPIPSSLPAFGSSDAKAGSPIRVDAIENLWVKDYTRPAEQHERWSVFGTSGRFFGTVSFPPGFTPLDIRDGFVLGKSKDSLDVEHVQVYELLKPRGS